MARSPLLERLARVPQIGRLSWIGVRRGHETPMETFEVAEVIEDHGLRGDRAAQRSGGKRQITLIQAEHLGVIARLVGRERVEPTLVRRNLVIEGINLKSLERLRFAIGDEVVLEGTGPCEPCAKMDVALGEGGFHAMRGHGGITTRVLRGGTLRVGDAVRALPPEEE